MYVDVYFYIIYLSMYIHMNIVLSFKNVHSMQDASATNLDGY